MTSCVNPGKSLTLSEPLVSSLTGVLWGPMSVFGSEDCKSATHRASVGQHLCREGLTSQAAATFRRACLRGWPLARIWALGS